MGENRTFALKRVLKEGDEVRTLNWELTLIELEAEIWGRAHAGVVDGFSFQVISGVHISPKLNQELDQINVFDFGCVVKRRLM